MVLLDALVFNTDRHPYNFGVLRDQTTGEPLSLAPIFDHNLSLSAVLADYDRFAGRGNGLPVPGLVPPRGQPAGVRRLHGAAGHQPTR